MIIKSITGISVKIMIKSTFQINIIHLNQITFKSETIVIPYNEPRMIDIFSETLIWKVNEMGFYSPQQIKVSVKQG